MYSSNILVMSGLSLSSSRGESLVSWAEPFTRPSTGSNSTSRLWSIVLHQTVAVWSSVTEDCGSVEWCYSRLWQCGVVLQQTAAVYTVPQQTGSVQFTQVTILLLSSTTLASWCMSMSLREAINNLLHLLKQKVLVSLLSMSNISHTRLSTLAILKNNILI